MVIIGSKVERIRSPESARAFSLVACGSLPVSPGHQYLESSWHRHRRKSGSRLLLRRRRTWVLLPPARVSGSYRLSGPEPPPNPHQHTLTFRLLRDPPHTGRFSPRRFGLCRESMCCLRPFRSCRWPKRQQKGTLHRDIHDRFLPRVRDGEIFVLAVTMRSPSVVQRRVANCHSPGTQIIRRARGINLRIRFYITRSGAGLVQVDDRFTGCDEGAKGRIRDEAMIDKWLAGGGVGTAQIVN